MNTNSNDGIPNFSSETNAETGPLYLLARLQSTKGLTPWAIDTAQSIIDQSKAREPKLDDMADTVFRIHWEQQAFNVQSALKAGELVAYSNGKLPKDPYSRTIEHAKRQLREHGFLSWRSGPNGGTYLTDAGQKYAAGIYPHSSRGK